MEAPDPRIEGAKVSLGEANVPNWSPPEEAGEDSGGGMTFSATLVIADDGGDAGDEAPRRFSTGSPMVRGETDSHGRCVLDLPDLRKADRAASARDRRKPQRRVVGWAGA